MAETQFNVKLDLIEQYTPAEDITIPQENDLSVKFTYSIFNREIAEDLTGATDIVVSFVKPDGNIVLQSNGSLELPNKVNIVANAQAFTYVGKVYMQVQYKKGVTTFNTRQAFFWVERSNTSCQTVASSSFAPYLDNAVAAGEKFEGLDVQALVDSKQTAENAQTDVNLVKPRVETLENDVVGLNVRASKVLTPEQFGAIGDGVADDFNALKELFGVAKDCIVRFRKGATYLVRTFGFVTENGNLDIQGNGATIKLKDFSGMLTRIYNGTEVQGENICLYFKKDNITLNDLNFDANVDNNYFVHNGEIYYGYQQDLNIPGVPAKYITTYGIQSYEANNVKYLNCTFEGFGSGIFSGEVWDNDKIVNGFVVDGCTFRNGFRDQVVFFQSRDITIQNNYFYNNQRKAIQFYQNASDSTVFNNEVEIEVGLIRKWHPQWAPTFFDVELGGVSFNNVNYYQEKYNCNNATVLENRFIKTKFGVSMRHYSKDLKVRNNTFDQNVNGVIFLNGMRGTNEVEGNNFYNCISGVELNLDRHTSITEATTATYNALLTIGKNNTVGSGNLLTVNDIQNKQNLYNLLTVTVKDNKASNGAGHIFLNSNRSVSSRKCVDLNQGNNLRDFIPVTFSGDNNIIRNANRKGSYKFTTPTMGAKPNAGFDYIKVMTLETAQTLQNATIRGNLMTNNIADAHYADFMIVIRSNSNIAWNSVVNAYTFNRLSTRPADSIRVVEENLTDKRRIHIYLYVPNSEGQTVMTIDNLDEISSAYSVEMTDSTTWLNNYLETGSPYVTPSSSMDSRLVSVPTSATASGKRGDYAIDTSYSYYCVADNTWRRSPLTSW